MFPARVKAVLGPTNTGKTHLAIERMLAHSSGVIGFPLRLLARENYDRMVTRKGIRHVALITGEEKIVPPDARWFACTVEAMPLDRAAEFVAVDEIQLCADPDRGHIFTDRLLHARGTVETMFLGAETIRPLLKRLVPHAEVETRPRLSQLGHAGNLKLSRLPPRSAVVAFSAGEVYAIAELIRRRRGGCAVVMGRLSPRTRNAQVALYQAKEVDFLVATDAIGMGLNMDVDHVGFARQSKFDGHRPRLLTPAEAAQIAGRAGRGMRDGTFGTTAQCPPLSPEVVEAVETHSFAPLEELTWRNADLDFGDIDALLASLLAPPPRPGLVKGRDATDLETLIALAREPDLRAQVSSRSMTRLLWEACQVPDFRKLADDSHTRLCARIFGHLAQDGVLPTDWLAGQIAALSRADGDIDTLMQRLSNVRVWAYVAARPSWVGDAAHWQAETREVEEKLSDALHERLTARFVDRRATHLLRRLEAPEGEELLSAVTAQGEVVVEGHPVGHVAGFGFTPDPISVGDERRLVLRAARRALRQEMPRRVGALDAAEDAAFGLDDARVVMWDGAPVARLQPGAQMVRPQLQVLDSEFLDGRQRDRVRQRLQRWLDALVHHELAPLFAAEAEAARRPRAARPPAPPCRGRRRGARCVRRADRSCPAPRAEGAGAAGRAVCAVPSGPAQAPACGAARPPLGLATGRAAALHGAGRRGLHATAGRLAAGLCRGDGLAARRAHAAAAGCRRARRGGAGVPVTTWCRPGARRPRLQPVGEGGAAAGGAAHAGRAAAADCQPAAGCRRTAGTADDAGGAAAHRADASARTAFGRPVRRAGCVAAVTDSEDRDFQRLDKWLWCARFLKARSDCARLVTDGMIRLNRQPTDKPHARLRPGDVITMTLRTEVRVIRVLALASRRGPAPEAQRLYAEIPEPTAAVPCAGGESSAYPRS